MKIICNTDSIRLDRLLREETGAPQSLISKMMRKKRILINGLQSNQVRVVRGDSIEVLDKIASIERAKTYVTPENMDLFNSSVIFENDDIIVINKPCGMASQGGTGIDISVDEIAHAIGAEFRIIHRLDKETSGVMVIAKTRSVASKCALMFKDQEISKIYIAQCVERSENIPQDGIVDAQIHKDVMARKMVISHTDGLAAVTSYKTLQVQNGIRLVEIHPLTGRTHQIRIHLSSIGLPIIGDKMYDGIPGKRLMLHAKSIKIGDLIVECDVPKEFDLSRLA